MLDVLLIETWLSSSYFFFRPIFLPTGQHFIVCNERLLTSPLGDANNCMELNQILFFNFLVLLGTDGLYFFRSSSKQKKKGSKSDSTAVLLGCACVCAYCS